MEETPPGPIPRLGIRETWAQFRRSTALNDLLAECALWTAPWTGLPPYQGPDCAEEFALCAAVWSGLPYYDDGVDAQALRNSISPQTEPRPRGERR
jgi:hypothetical protein